MRIRNARQSGVALRSANVIKHQTNITLDSDRVKTGSLRGAVVTSRFRGPIWRKNAIFRALGAPVVVDAGQRRVRCRSLDAGYVLVGEPVEDDE